MEHSIKMTNQEDEQTMKIPSEVAVNRALNTLLEGAIMPSELSAGRSYGRVQDDCEGIKDYSQSLSVTIAHDSDVWVNAGGYTALRFRVPFIGGGMSFRVRNALLVLAEAIRRDNEESPYLSTKPMEDDHYQYRKPTVKVLISCPEREAEEIHGSLEVDTGLYPKDIPDRDKLLNEFQTLYRTLWRLDSVTAVFSSNF